MSFGKNNINLHAKKLFIYAYFQREPIYLSMFLSMWFGMFIVFVILKHLIPRDHSHLLYLHHSTYNTKSCHVIKCSKLVPWWSIIPSWCICGTLISTCLWVKHKNVYKMIFDDLIWTWRTRETCTSITFFNYIRIVGTNTIVFETSETIFCSYSYNSNATQTRMLH